MLRVVLEGVDEVCGGHLAGEDLVDGAEDRVVLVDAGLEQHRVELARRRRALQLLAVEQLRLELLDGLTCPSSR